MARRVQGRFLGYVRSMKSCCVIMPAFAATRWIREAVESVLTQDPLAGWTWELRIGVDGCPATSEALTELGVGHWFATSNVGPYVIRNSLMALAPADAWATFDADDVMQRKYLATAVPLAMPDGIGGTGRVHINEQGARVSTGIHHAVGVSVYSAEAMRKLGGFRAWPIAADRDLAHRAGRLKIPTRRTGQVCYFRRVHAGALTKAPRTRFGSQLRTRLYGESKAHIRRGELHVEPVTAAMEWRGPEL